MVAEVALPPVTEQPPISQEQPPAAPVLKTQPPTPSPSSQPIHTIPSSAIPDWAIYLIGAQVVMIALALVVILLLVARTKRSG